MEAEIAEFPRRHEASTTIPTDLGEDLVREYRPGQGLVDVKVAAVDPTWSVLAFVRRPRDR